jgi:hypothetical protein
VNVLCAWSCRCEAGWSDPRPFLHTPNNSGQKADGKHLKVETRGYGVMDRLYVLNADKTVDLLEHRGLHKFHFKVRVCVPVCSARRSCVCM